jgi:hypothetical protein
MDGKKEPVMAAHLTVLEPERQADSIVLIEAGERLPRHEWNRGVVNLSCELFNAYALRCDDPQLAQMRPHCIRQHCALTHE